MDLFKEAGFIWLPQSGFCNINCSGSGISIMQQYKLLIKIALRSIVENVTS